MVHGAGSGIPLAAALLARWAVGVSAPRLEVGALIFVAISASASVPFGDVVVAAAAAVSVQQLLELASSDLPLY